MKIIWGSLIISILLFLLPAQGYSLSISPPTVVLQTSPGETRTSVINVFNEKGIGHYKISVYATDIGFDKKGQRIFKRPGGFPNSFAKNIKISPEEFEITDRKGKDVKITLEVPKDIVGGHQSIVFFEATPIPSKFKKKQRMLVRTRLGATILHEIKGTVNLKSRIRSINVSPPTAAKSMGFNLEVVNDGNTHFYGSAIIAVLNNDDHYIGNINIPKTLILPGRTQKLSGEWKGNLKDGKYHALVTYQYGEDKNVTIDKVFDFKNQ
jgi:hypothetical protein